MKINNETKIGVMVTLVILILGIMTVKTGNFNLSRNGYTIKVHFKNIDGVNLNSPVMFNGFEVGIVEDVEIIEEKDETKMELTLKIRDSVKLRGGTKAYVKNLGFMGEKFVGLTSGNKSEDFLPEGSIVIGKEPADFDRLIRDGQEIATNLKEISGNINERLDKNKDNLDGILENTNKTMNNVASITENVDNRLSKNEEKIDQMLSNMNKTSVNLEEMTADLKLNPWKILHRPK